MILDKVTASVLTVKDWPTLADIRTGVVKRDRDEETGLDLIFMKNPSSLGDDSMVAISHSVAALRDGMMIFSASLESLDLRSLSSALGESVKSLQGEYGIRGYLTPARITLYGNGEKEDIGVYLYGVYGAVMDFRSLVPTVTMTLGVSAIPVISAAWAVRNQKAVGRTVNSVIRTVMLLALPAGFAMAVLSEPLLNLIYGGTRTANMVDIAAPMLTAYGFATPIMAVSAPVTHMLQAVGRTDVPVKSLMMGATAKIVADYILVGNPQINIYGAPVGSILNGVIVVFYELACLIAETGAVPDIKSVFLKPFFCACVSTITAKLAFSGLKDALSLSSAFSLLLSVIAAVAVYILLLTLIKGISGEDLRMIPKGEKIAKRLEKFGLLG